MKFFEFINMQENLLLANQPIEDKLISDYLNTSRVSIELGFLEGFLILLISTLVGLYIKKIYNKYAITYSSRTAFGNTLLVLTISVSALIAVVKTSLALSLGLVGALSVIRFRSAIKEPFNLSVMLFAICTAIAIGASQFIFSFLILIFGTFAIIYSKNSYMKSSRDNKSFDSEDIDTISISLPFDSSLSDFYEILQKHTKFFSLISLDQNQKENMILVLNVKVLDQKDLIEIKEKIFAQYPNSSFSFYNSPSQ